jgi:hypothetical protein
MLGVGDRWCGWARRWRGLCRCSRLRFIAHLGAASATLRCSLQGARKLRFRPAFWVAAHERVRNSGGELV